MDSALFEGLSAGLEHLCDVAIDLAPNTVGLTTKGPFATRSVFHIGGGSFEGPRLKGKVHSGSDYPMTARNDTTTVALDVRSVWQADNGDLIYVYYFGRLVTPPHLKRDLFDPARNHAVDPGKYYWRVAPVFETASVELGWLNNLVTVGAGRYTKTGLAYRLYAVT
ncbi:DUF3237 domain-containing protein [Emcibacter sp. SYSU 3D8]|uniref:DUF3237 domain-containing protein n=1 Tax=Emcibacter sp. SYSU 3D8 TaxID=3133969 RepID=UPI0031FF0512